MPKASSPARKASAKKPAKTAKTKITAKKTARKSPKSASRANATNAQAALAPQRIRQILACLDERYPNVTCALTHHTAWELLVATILSAQCTDATVNKVTPGLFMKYPTPGDFAALKPEQLEPDIRPTGFFRNKSKSLVGAAQGIMKGFNGQVPDQMEQLLTLPGVARKTANVVLGTWFHKAIGVVVDTHVQRISRRLELTSSENPKDIERDLMKVVPQERWIDFSHQIIHHGRAVCIARKPKCADCNMESLCHAADKTWSTVEIHKWVKPL